MFSLKKKLCEQSQDCTDCIKNGEEAIIERILSKQMEQSFHRMFEHKQNEHNLIVLLSITDPDLPKQRKLLIKK